MAPASPARGSSLNPITKLTMLVAFSVAVLSLSSEAYVLALLVAALVAERAFDVKGTAIVKGVTSFALAIFVAQLLFNHSGDEVARFWIFRVTTGGIGWGIVIAGKFLTLVTMSKVFVATTKASDLSSALISAGVPYRAAFMPALAMRFVPVFQLELATVRDAQVTRGLRLGRGLRGLVRSVRYTTLPMLYVALSKVNYLASSMVGRGFGAYPKRTLLRDRRMTPWDVGVVVVTCALAAVLFLLNLECPLDLTELL